MAKVRVHELAKELGITSKKLLAVLKDNGEFVKSASSTIEAPVVRKARQYFEAHPEEAGGKKKSAVKRTPARKKAPAVPETRSENIIVEEAPKKAAPKPGPRPKPGNHAPKPAAPKPGPAKPATVKAEEAPKPAPQPAAPKPAAPKSAAPKPAAPKPAAPAQPKRSNIPTPMGAHRSAQQAREEAAEHRRGPRPGNNPFTKSQGMPRPGGGRGKPQSQNGGKRHGAHPSPAMMPDQANQQLHAPGSPNAGGRRGGGRGRGHRGSANGSRPGAGFVRGGGKARGGSTAGAFGRGRGRGGNRSHRRNRREEIEAQSSPMARGVRIPNGNGKTVRIRQGASVADFADQIGASSADIITVLFRMGEMATINQSLDEDTFKLLGDELGYSIEVLSPEDEDRQILESFDINLENEEILEDEANMVSRPPVVTVMGHVDHGKTKLLDAIRHTAVEGTESGGITQSIGAYQTTITYEGERRTLTFIDTPGHEAFTAMRARGADITDIAVLVVAADDGVMPQTVEAINHAAAAGVKIVVAVNKVDLPNANPQKVRSQLTEYGLVAEEYGGDTLFVDISAKQRMGIDDLLEAVLYTADAELELKANPDGPARGTAIEAKLDQGRGSVISALIQSGTLHVGDPLVVGTAYGRVRALFNDHGENVEEATPSQPVQIIGLSTVPSAGDNLLVTDDERTARQIAEQREAAQRAATLAKRRKRISLENLNDALKKGATETLNLIIKGDSSGSVEALESSLLEIKMPDEVSLDVIHRGVGAVTQNDVNLATVDNAVIIGFNVRPAERVQAMADREGVEMKFYSVIYQAIEDVEAALKGMLKLEYEEAQTGTAEVRQLFHSGKAGTIAGSIVRSGSIKRGSKARLVRDGVVVAPELEIASLRREKDDVTEVKEGYECGITLGYKDIHEGDIIETFEMREKPRD